VSAAARSMVLALAREAVRVLRSPKVQPPDVSAAVETFIANPNPAVYVGAVRELRKLYKQAQVGDALSAHRRKERERALELLRETGASGLRLASRVSLGDCDPKAADRVRALACLLGAYEELEARAQWERDALRRKLGLE
jgi:hypothetical protein